MNRGYRIFWNQMMVVLILQTSSFAIGSMDGMCSLFDDCTSHERAWRSTDAGEASPRVWAKLPREQEIDFIEKFISTSGDSARRALFNTYAAKWSTEGSLIEYRTLNAIMVGLDSEQVKLDVLNTLFEKRILSERLSPKALLNLLSFFDSDKNKMFALKASLSGYAVSAESSMDEALRSKFRDPIMGEPQSKHLTLLDESKGF